MRARKTDGNLTEIVKAARAFGMIVHITNADWDLTVQLRKDCGPVEIWEVKNGRGRVTDTQKRLSDEGWVIRKIRNVQDVINARKEMMA